MVSIRCVLAESHGSFKSVPSFVLKGRRRCQVPFPGLSYRDESASDRAHILDRPRIVAVVERLFQAISGCRSVRVQVLFLFMEPLKDRCCR